MKKENRKIAQEQKAAARRKARNRHRLRVVLQIGIPAAIIVVIILLIIINPSLPGSGEEETEAAAAEEAQISVTAETEAVTFSTDSSLTVEDGDTVNIDYVGSIDGVEFSGGSTGGYGTDLTIGSGMYIDNFEEQLIGSHPGDTVDVVVTFPEDYGSAELDGQEALFVVTVNGIY